MTSPTHQLLLQLDTAALSVPAQRGNVLLQYIKQVDESRLPGVRARSGTSSDGRLWSGLCVDTGAAARSYIVLAGEARPVTGSKHAVEHVGQFVSPMEAVFGLRPLLEAVVAAHGPCGIYRTSGRFHLFGSIEGVLAQGVGLWPQPALLWRFFCQAGLGVLEPPEGLAA